MSQRDRGQDWVQGTSRPAWHVPAFALLLLAETSCGSDHHVSPWPQDFSLKALIQPPDLERHLSRIDEEMVHEQMRKEEEIVGTFAVRSRFVIRSYTGADPVRRERSAVRVATDYGIVLALGPQEPAQVHSGIRSRLVPSLADGGGWRSGTDLNGDGLPDVVVRGDDGTLEVWGLLAHGSAPYPVKSLVPPDRAIDLDEDGRPDLAGRATISGWDPIEPMIIEAMQFADGTYRYDTPAVRTWHANEAQAGASGRPGRGECGDLGAVLERCWHSIRSGQPANQALEQADAAARMKAPLRSGCVQAWVRWRGWLATASRGGNTAISDSAGSGL